MAKWMAVGLMLVLLAVVMPAHAQTETPTPTETFTPSPTPTVTPDLYVVWTLEPRISATADPGYTPGQAVAVQMVMSIDGVVISLLLFAIFIVLLIMIVLFLFRTPSGTAAK